MSKIVAILPWLNRNALKIINDTVGESVAEQGRVLPWQHL